MQAPSSNVLEGIFISVGLPAILIWAVVAKSWLPIILLVFLVALASGLKFVYVPMVAVDTDRAEKYHWFTFGCLAVFLLWAIYEATGN